MYGENLMTYIILRDTFGNGLETIPNIGVDVIEEHQLDDYIWDAAKTILAEDGYATVTDYDEENIALSETLVICEILEKLKDKTVPYYIDEVLMKRETEYTVEEYELYLKLKEKFEK
jgi:threonine dehydratase